MLDVKASIIAGATAFAVGALSAWWLTAEYKESKYQAVISTMKSDAAAAVQAALIRNMEIAEENSRLATELEIANATNRKKLDEVEADNRRLTSELGGLYDRQSAASDRSVPAAPGAAAGAAPAAAGRKLSDELTALLLSESRRADEAAAYAQTCYDWIKRLKLSGKP